MKIVVAGTGSIGQRHIRNLQTLRPETDFVLYRESGHEDAMSRALDAPVVTSLGALAGIKPDALIIATPSALHGDLLEHAIRAGLPAYVEKPVVTTSADVARLRRAMAETSDPAPVLAGHNLRFLPSLQHMQTLVADGAIGKLCRAHFEAGQWLPDWRPDQDHRTSYSADPARGGGVILDLVHEIDAARWMCGDLALAGSAAHRAPVLDIATEAAAVASLGGGEQPAVSIAVDYLCQVPVRRYRLVGEAGVLDWDLGARRLCLTTRSGVQDIDCGPSGFDMGATYPAAMSAWLAAMAGQDWLATGLEDGLRTTELALEIRKAAPC